MRERDRERESESERASKRASERLGASHPTLFDGLGPCFGYK
jgi:hypothetical protein